MWEWYVLAGLLGAIIGSFLNVCIYRLPRQESVAWPGSHCPACGQAIRWHDNIPFIGYLLLRGRCRACKGAIALRYPAVEALNAVGYVGMLWWFGPGWEALIYAVFYSALLVVAGTDLTHKIIPNAVTYPGVIAGVASAGLVLPLGWGQSLLGVLVGGGLLWVLAWASPYLFGKEGMGGGDIKLMGMVGAVLGWKLALLTIMIGSLLGSVVGVALIGTNTIGRQDYIPFGPFLVCGALVSLLFGIPVIEWYQGLLGG